MKPKLLLLWILSTSLAWAQSSAGPLGAGSGADNNGVGTVAWTSPGNITQALQSGADNVSTAANATFGRNAISHYLFAQTYGFSIPSNGTVVGIVGTLYGDGGSGATNCAYQESTIKSIKGGAVGGNNKATVGTFPNNGTYSNLDTWGASNDLWGQTWAYSDINAVNFGIAVSIQGTTASDTCASVYISSVTVTVYYTVPTPMGVRRPIVMAQTRKAQSIHVHATD